MSLRQRLLGPETRRQRRVAAVAACVIAVLIVGVAAYQELTSTSSPAAPQATRPRNAQALLARLPLGFVANGGQTDERVAFTAEQAGTSFWFTRRGVTLAVLGPKDERPRRWIVRQALLGRAVQPVGERQGAGTVSYFKGSPSDWHTGLPAYGRVRYRGVWRGVDVVYAGSGDTLEYTFRVEPGADPGAIRLAYRGASSVRLEHGELVVETPLGAVHDTRPHAWQLRGGGRIAVPVAFDLGRAGTYGFRLGDYDQTRPLFIDPSVLYDGYVGGAGEDGAIGIAVDAAGSAYVAGSTTSDATTFPAVVGPDLAYHGQQDAFVAKVNPAGTGLVYTGYIGGDSLDTGRSIAVDASGNAYVAGLTSSDEASFPVNVGPDLTYNGGTDDWVAKVNAAGDDLGYAGYVGGSGLDGAVFVAVDTAGSAYLAGSTQSTEASFPVAGGLDSTYNGGGDAFAAKVEPAGDGLAYAGYIGGEQREFVQGAAVDDDGAFYVTGGTDSSEASFPATAGPDLTFNGGNDAFVAKVDPGGSGLAYAGYIGGADTDVGRGIAVDGAGNAYLTGVTASDQASFPVTVGPDLTFNGALDGFVAKIDASGSALAYAGYIGGSEADDGIWTAVDAAGNAYVAGHTRSSEATFPAAVGPDLTYNGGWDGFVAKVDPAGSSLAYAGYIGGTAEDLAWGLDVDTAGNAYVAGWTHSDQSTFPVAVGPDLTQNGDRDGFVAKIGGPPALDHFKCYTAAGARLQRLVKLEDQFGLTRVVVDAPRTLCNPVSKNDEPIANPRGHLKCYDLQRPVTTTDQFRKQHLVVDLARTLCTPASKTLTGPPPPPPADLDHFQCYPLTKAPSASKGVKLRDQFRTESVKVDRPVSLCNPVRKNGRRLVNPRAHLLCYRIVGKPTSLAARVRDQFRTETLQVGNPETLCLPSSKHAFGD